MDLTRTIDELNTLYGLEPDLRDVFVEGTIDKAFLDWYVHRKKWPNVSVYPVDLVEIPDALLKSYGLPLRSKRSRLIALSRELVRLRPVRRRIMCIIDRDSDDQAFVADANPYLYCTDGNALELYALTPAVMEKFLLVCLGGFPLSVDNLMTQVVSILQRLYVIRQATRSLGRGMEWIPFNKYVFVDGSAITFRERDFVRAYLQKNNRWASRERFLQAIDEEARKLNPDPRRSIRGHDLSELLRRILLKLKKTRVFGNVETVEGCLMTAIEVNDLEDQSLFVALKDNMNAGAS
jgi:hypothetical protein